jgi:hypothetical protein
MGAAFAKQRALARAISTQGRGGIDRLEPLELGCGSLRSADSGVRGNSSGANCSEQVPSGNAEQAINGYMAQKPRIGQMASVLAPRDTCFFESCPSRESNGFAVEF